MIESTEKDSINVAMSGDPDEKGHTGQAMVEDDSTIEFHVKLNRYTGEFEFIKKPTSVQDGALMQMLLNTSNSISGTMFFKPKNQLIARPGQSTGVMGGMKQNPAFMKKIFK